MIKKYLHSLSIQFTICSDLHKHTVGHCPFLYMTIVFLSSMEATVDMIKSVREIFANGDKIVILLTPSSLFAPKFYCVKQILNIQILLLFWANLLLIKSNFWYLEKIKVWEMDISYLFCYILLVHWDNNKVLSSSWHI